MSAPHSHSRVPPRTIERRATQRNGRTSASADATNRPADRLHLLSFRLLDEIASTTRPRGRAARSLFEEADRAPQLFEDPVIRGGGVCRRRLLQDEKPAPLVDRDED